MCEFMTENMGFVDDRLGICLKEFVHEVLLCEEDT